MRTVGEILKKARTEKKLTFEDIEKQIRIRKKFLAAIEENEWRKLPSLPYIKGFLKSYSSFLGLKSEEMLAIFRRQYQYSDTQGIIPTGVSHPLNSRMLTFSPQLSFFILSILAMIIFFFYLFFQYTSYINPPKLTLIKPLEGETFTKGDLKVTGITDHDAVVTVNGQKVALNEQGEFEFTITLNPGINTITIGTTGKNGKTRTTSRTVQFSQNS